MQWINKYFKVPFFCYIAKAVLSASRSSVFYLGEFSILILETAGSVQEESYKYCNCIYIIFF